MTDPVGIVGLGIMGGAMARHLAASGLDVIGYDVDPAAAERAGVAGTALADLLARAPMIVTSLPGTGALAAVIDAAGGLPPCTIIDTSTLSLDDKLMLAERATAAGHRLLDCPVSGTGAQMAVRDVVIYASGLPDDVARATPILERFARRVLDLGAFGNGTRCKLVANLLVAVHNVAAAEAIRLGVAAGLDPALLIEAVSDGAGQSRIFSLRAPMMAADSYLPATMKVGVFLKDLDAIASLAAATGSATPLLDAADPLYRALADAGDGALDTAAVALAIDRLARKDSR